MSHVDMAPPRNWREIAALLAKEEEPHKILLLAEEMIRALDAESSRQMDKVSAADKAGESEAA